MGRIKTRENVKDIKILDKAAVASERMKTALVRSKDQAENLMDDGQISPSEYAEDKIRYAAEDVTDQVWHEVSGQTKKAIERGKEAHRERRNEKRIHKNEERVRRYEEELRRGAPSRTPREDAARQAARQNKVRIRIHHGIIIFTLFSYRGSLGNVIFLVRLIYPVILIVNVCYTLYGTLKNLSFFRRNFNQKIIIHNRFSLKY